MQAEVKRVLHEGRKGERSGDDIRLALIWADNTFFLFILSQCMEGRFVASHACLMS